MIKQKTYEIFIRPYLKYKDNRIICKESLFAHTRDLQGISGSGFTEYTASRSRWRMLDAT